MWQRQPRCVMHLWGQLSKILSPIYLCSFTNSASTPWTSPSHSSFYIILAHSSLFFIHIFFILSLPLHSQPISYFYIKTLPTQPPQLHYSFILSMGSDPNKLFTEFVLFLNVLLNKSKLFILNLQCTPSNYKNDHTYCKAFFHRVISMLMMENVNPSYCICKTYSFI